MIPMAVRERREIYSHATIDCSDMTLTEYRNDDVRVYSVIEILKRWNGVPGIEIEIRQSADLPANRGEDIHESEI